jgi:predicted kinase
VDGRLIIVSGSPGVGKSALARRLARDWPGEAALPVHSDDAWTWFVKGFIPPWRPDSEGQNRVVMQAMAAQAAILAAGGYPVFYDGVLGPWFVAFFREAAQAHGAPLDLIMLRPDRETTLARGVSRPDHPMRDPQVIGQLWDQFAELGDLQAHVLDTTHLDLAATADAARAGLQAGRFRLA